jgi:hypothetical protein
MLFSAALAVRITLLFLAINSAIVASDSLANQFCSCGYFDSSTGDLFTDSIIVYFNETQSLPSDFVVQSYQNRYEKGWNTQFRQGAVAVNVNIGNSSTTPELQTPRSLELYCNVTTPDHLVEGGGIRTARQDVFFGSFRASFRGSQQWLGGSALSIMAFFNETQSWEMDNINPDEPSTAWISMISHTEFPSRDLGVNYTALQSQGINPWNWTEHRVDWLRDELRYYVGGHLIRRVTRKQDSLLPLTPAPIFLKHWSTGNFFSTQGAPAQRSLANVAWTRMFFNSSLSTAKDHEAFAARCNPVDACRMNDTTLRGSSTIPHLSTQRWKQIAKSGGDKTVPRFIAYSSISATALILLLAFRRHFPWSSLMKKASQTLKPDLTKSWPLRQGGDLHSDSLSELFNSFEPSIQHTRGDTPEDIVTTTRPSSIYNLRPGTTLEPMPSPSRSDSQNTSSLKFESEGATAHGSPSVKFGPASDDKKETTRITNQSVSATPNETPTGINSCSDDPDRISFTSQFTAQSNEKSKDGVLSTTVAIKGPATSTVSGQDTSNTPAAPKAKARVDYLAGLIAVSSLLVTGIHFCLTFSAAAINPGAFIHHHSEVWARKTIVSYFLNLNWIGPFLMTSTRFLVASYLKTGDARGLAQKTVGRPFRLIVPVAVIAMLEYFLMDAGATTWLEYLASVTWSTWPFTTVPDNFGDFLSEILELAFLIPNAAPQIIFNYCTGVLWTIPVQLQGSWTTILAVIMIREIRTPWKRFCFYFFCISMHWYALSWGSYFYLGIMLTDLDVTYDWKKWLYAHAPAYYTLAILSPLLAVGGLTLDMVPQWTNVNYAEYEYGVHPDTNSGRAIIQTSNFAYPQYFEPVSLTSH